MSFVTSILQCWLLCKREWTFLAMHQLPWQVSGSIGSLRWLVQTKGQTFMMGDTVVLWTKRFGMSTLPSKKVLHAAGHANAQMIILHVRTCFGACEAMVQGQARSGGRRPC